MSHGLKALLIAASTIITCIIVGLGFSMAREAKQIGNYVVKELHSYRVAVEEQDYTKYDGVTVYGTDVVNLMKYAFTVEESGVSVVVEENGECRIYAEAEDIKRAGEIGNMYYITPAAEYTGEVKRNKNNVIVEILFKKNGG